MNACTTIHSTSLPDTRGASVAVQRIAGRAFAWLRARRRAEQDRALLARMSDRELRDIGIERADIAAVADGCWMRV